MGKAFIPEENGYLEIGDESFLPFTRMRVPWEADIT